MTPRPLNAESDETLTTRPSRRASSSGSTARIRGTGPEIRRQDVVPFARLDPNRSRTTEHRCAHDGARALLTSPRVASRGEARGLVP